MNVILYKDLVKAIEKHTSKAGRELWVKIRANVTATNKKWTPLPSLL